MKSLSDLAQEANLGTPPTIPKGHGTYSYYNAQMAIRVKELMDQLGTWENPQNVFVNAEILRMKPRTIVQWYKQGLGYLLTYADPDKKYAKLWPQIFAKVTAEGVTFLWLKNVGFDPTFVKKSVVKVSKDVAELYNWRERLQNFIENAQPGEELSLNVHLTESEEKQIRTTLRFAEHLFFEVNTHSIKVTYRRDVPEAPKDNIGLVIHERFDV